MCEKLLECNVSMFALISGALKGKRNDFQGRWFRRPPTLLSPSLSLRQQGMGWNRNQKVGKKMSEGDDSYLISECLAGIQQVLRSWLHQRWLHQIQ